MTESTFTLRQRDGTAQWHSLVKVSGGLQLTVGYRRCLEFDPSDLPGQDFVSVVYDGATVVAVVADGVSQSFLGDIAARQVGAHLAKTLWSQRLRPPEGRAVREALEEIRPVVDREVRAYQFGAEVPGMVRAALDDARTTSGSQTCFSAVILDVASRSATVYLLGDVTVLTHLADGTAQPLEGDRRGRWSSLHGVRKVETAVETVVGVRALVIKSDGMGEAWGVDPTQVHDAERFRQLAIERAAKDDMSFVALDLTAAMPFAPMRLHALRRVESAPAPGPGEQSARVDGAGGQARGVDPTHAMHGQLHASMLSTGEATPGTAPASGTGGLVLPSSAISSPSLFEDLVNEQHRRSRPGADPGSVPATVGIIGTPGVPTTSSALALAASSIVEPPSATADVGLLAAFSRAAEPPPSSLSASPAPKARAARKSPPSQSTPAFEPKRSSLVDWILRGIFGSALAALLVALLVFVRNNHDDGGSKKPPPAAGRPDPLPVKQNGPTTPPTTPPERLERQPAPQTSPASQPVRAPRGSRAGADAGATQPRPAAARAAPVGGATPVPSNRGRAGNPEGPAVHPVTPRPVINGIQNVLQGPIPNPIEAGPPRASQRVASPSSARTDAGDGEGPMAPSVEPR